MLNVQQMKCRLLEAGIATQARIRGCSEDEIASLQRHIGFDLPHAYREFLLAFGHCAGNFWVSMEFTIDKIVRINGETKDILTELGSLDLFLPVHGFVIAMRSREKFLYFLADGESQNPPLYHFTIAYSEAAKVEYAEFTRISDTFWDGIDTELAGLERIYAEYPTGDFPWIR